MGLGTYFDNNLDQIKQFEEDFPNVMQLNVEFVASQGVGNTDGISFIAAGPLTQTPGAHNPCKLNNRKVAYKVVQNVQDDREEPCADMYMSSPPTAKGQEGEDLESRAKIGRLRGIANALARQMVMQQAQSEQWARSKGGSGLVQVRSYNGGTEDYFDAAVANSNGIAAIHHHANFERTMGLGEFAAVLNGVEFWTRHNDYLFRMNCPPSTGRDNSDFIDPSLAAKSWTDFPTYIAAYNLVKQRIPSVSLNRVVKETCHLICKVSAELATPNDRGNRKRIEVRD